ncbi:MAG: CDP-glucose 4,6-dehydratase [Opitutaceae bacterium]
MAAFNNFYQGKRVLLTGHTGFKGAWMAEWLLELGADVVGVSLEPNTEPSLFEQLGLEGRLGHHIVDINDAAVLRDCVLAVRPDVVFHLAAQPLVRYSYNFPVETFATNIMGSIHLMDAIRHLKKPCEVVMVTTDKCYENKERFEPYCESDPMGGHDPYSASKGAAELVIASYRNSFFKPAEYGEAHYVRIASTRAGNVIGGGDWALDRIVPDCMKALAKGEPINVRNARATRPWQHVLEPVGGYLSLACCLAEAIESPRMEEICSGFNFGPDPAANRPVSDLVEKVISLWPGTWIDCTRPDEPYEAGLLNLTIDKADSLLGWRPAWNFDQAIEHTVEWYRTVMENPSLALETTRQQIAAYTNHPKI